MLLSMRQQRWHVPPAAGRMTLSEDVNLEEFVMAKDELSGADIKAVCTEAGLLALRERRMRVTQVRALHMFVRTS
jgi:ATP-dependent 26S proteasome regulatory subunit